MFYFQCPDRKNLDTDDSNFLFTLQCFRWINRRCLIGAASHHNDSDQEYDEEGKYEYPWAKRSPIGERTVIVIHDEVTDRSSNEEADEQQADKALVEQR